jgi:hypothetical protein
MANPENPSDPLDEVRDEAVTNPDQSPREDEERPAATQYSPEMGSVVVTRLGPEEEEA